MDYEKTLLAGDENGWDGRGIERQEAQQYRNRVMSQRIHAERTSSFEEIIQRIQVGTKRVEETAGQIEEIGNRIFGPLPQTEGLGTDEMKEPQGTFEHTIRALNYLDDFLGRLERAVTRIQNV